MNTFHFLAMAGPSQQGQSGNPLGFFLPIILVFVIMWLLIFRPQAKRQKEQKMMLEQLQKGDRILTVGGLIGTIVGVREKENVLIVKIAENVKVEMMRHAIARKLGENELAGSQS